jgi:hypothetical protein
VVVVGGKVAVTGKIDDDIIVEVEDPCAEHIVNLRVSCKRKRESERTTVEYSLVVLVRYVTFNMLAKSVSSNKFQKWGLERTIVEVSYVLVELV